MADPPKLDGLSIQDDKMSVEKLDFMLSEDPQFDKIKEYARCLPYPIESNERMQDMLAFIIKRMVQCVMAKSYDPGFLQWDSMLSYWKMLKYPMPKEKRIALAKLYFEICVAPGMPGHIVANCSDTLHTLIRSKKKLTIEDMRLPWRPIYAVIHRELFLSRRQFEINQTPYYMGYIAENCRRFIHPACIDEILQEVIPQINGTSLDSILATQYYLVTFLPLSHPQIYLPAIFKLWESINSSMFDDRMLGFMSQLAELHVDPSISDPARISSIPDDAKSDNETRVKWDCGDLPNHHPWTGIWKDVGIFTEDEWAMIMCKTLSSMEILLADAGSLGTGATADIKSSFELGRLPRPVGRIVSLSKIIVYSMSADGPVAPRSGATTPFVPETPADDFSGPKRQQTTYIAGSKALDSLIRLIVSTESFFHPNNSGSWTSELSSFIRSIAYEFNKRWYEEEQPDCKTPPNRRLTREMRRELCKCLRTVTLLGLFSRDAQTVANILSCLKSMIVMAPDLILPSILERAAPSLEALTETRRTTAMIKALGAVSLALVSRDVYYPGPKHLLYILDLLLPGIDLNDPHKTLCTTAFLIEISQHMRFGELVSASTSSDLQDIKANGIATIPDVIVDDASDMEDPLAPGLSREEEDQQLRDSTAGFADWVCSFVRRIIVLMENLPAESEAEGSSRTGSDDTDVVEAVISSCSQICVHMSDSLFELVLNLIFDYASTTVRNNAARAIHALVECVATANPHKTLAKFVPHCCGVIRQELENGASSLRTTSVSTPLPADSALHWNLAILRGALHNGGTAILEYKTLLSETIHMLYSKTFSKRGFSWTGKLLNTMLSALSNTYPLDSRFVNAEIWNRPEINDSHHLYWGKLYTSNECKIEWHVPSLAEIEFTLELMRQIVDPALSLLESLIEKGNVKPSDSVWRNDFCRNLSIARYAFTGTPTLMQEFISPQAAAYAVSTSDLLNEIPEFIAAIDPLQSGFALHQAHSPLWKAATGRKARFGAVLKAASEALRSIGTESAVDPIHMTIRAIRTYMTEYGDSRDTYWSQHERYTNDKNLSRRHAKQRKWSRAVFVARARLYHTARLKWNSIDRIRGPLQDGLIDELTEWSLCSYASLRSSSQGVLDALMSSYDGIRGRCLPVFFKSLCPGTDDDRMKGALYSLNLSGIARYVMSEPSFLPELSERLFGCQHNEKPSIQECVSALSENCLSCFAEPNILVYSIEHPGTSRAATQLASLVEELSRSDLQLVEAAAVVRKRRVQLATDAYQLATGNILRAANGPQIHWKYSIGAIRFLRTLVRRDQVISADQLRYFLEKTYDDHPSMRYYAQRAVMKSLRYMKIRTLAKSPFEIAALHVKNPLRRTIQIVQSHEFTNTYLSHFKVPIHYSKASASPQLQDKPRGGWLAWGSSLDLYLAPAKETSTYVPWEKGSENAIIALETIALDPSFWQKVSIHFAEENGSDCVAQDNISCVKSILQVLEASAMPSLQPVVEELLSVTDQHKQRAAAELIAAMIGGSKHWPYSDQEVLWQWISSMLPKMLGNNVKTDTLQIWTTFLEYVLGHKDPRRCQPLVDYILRDFMDVDYNSDSFFTPVKVSSFMTTFADELLWRFNPWMDEVQDRYWREIACDHDEIRTYISEMFQLASRIKARLTSSFRKSETLIVEQWRPRPSIPTAETFVRECRTLPSTNDIMGIREANDRARITELVEKFPVWREQRLPGARALQSTYDKVAMMVCKWMYLALLDTQAVMIFDLVLPLMQELFRFCEVNDNEELSNKASSLLTLMCAISPPKDLLEPMLDSVFDAIRKSSSWRVRLKALPILQVWYFRQFPLISEAKMMQMLEVCCECLDDEVIEVRETAAVTLSGILRCSSRRSILLLKDRFVRSVQAVKLPRRQSPEYSSSLRRLHGAILGVTALIDSFPYTVEKWTPELLIDVLAQHTYDPIPVSTAVRNCAANFKKTHQDTWHEDQSRFNEDQLATLATLLMGSSYYA